MPQRAALFARKSDAIRPKVSRGAFLLKRWNSASGEILERGCASDLEKRLHGSYRSFAFLCDVVPRPERFFDSFGVPSLSGSYRRNRPHRSRSPVNQPYRIARAKLNRNRLRAWLAGSSRWGHRVLRLPPGRPEKNQGWGRNQSEPGVDRQLASGHRSRDQSFQPPRNRAIAGQPGHFFLRY